MNGKALAPASRLLRLSVTNLMLLFFVCAQPLSPAEELEDWQIVNVLSDIIVEDPVIPVDEIGIEVSDGIVRLEGRVDNILAADRAVAQAGIVRGVRGVVNVLDVITPHRTDLDIQGDIEDALEADPIIRLWHILVMVDEGVVLLRGTVNSWQLKQLIEYTVRGVRGVREVSNRMVVDIDQVREDDVIERQIVEALHWDPYIDDGHVEIEVENGHVVLTGVVGSLAEKTRVLNKSMVAGVEAVDNEMLLVDPALREEDLREPIVEQKSEEEIAAAVEAAIDHDPRVRLTAIEVGVVADTVVLEGTVDFLRTKRAAGQTARHVVGVRRVDNQIDVMFDPPVDDHTVERRVRQAFLRHPYLAENDVEIAVDNGIVRLDGEVDSMYVRMQAEELAAMQRGVIDVTNLLQVEDPEEIIFDPYIDPWSTFSDPAG